MRKLKSAISDLGFFLRKRKAIFIPLGIIFLLCAFFGIYIGYFFLGKKALLGVKVGDISISGENQEQIVAKLKAYEANVKVGFTNAGGKELSLAELGYQLDAEATAKKALAYNDSLSNYFSAFFNTRVVEPEYKIDSPTLSKAAAELSKECRNYVAAVEPTVKYDDKTKEFVAIEGKDGNGADPKAILAAAQQAMRSAKTITTEVSYGATKPLGNIEQARELAKELNSLLGHKYEIATSLGDKKSFVVDKDTLASWIKIPELFNQEKIEFNQEHIDKWLSSIKNQVDYKPVSGSRYVAPSGKILKVVTAGKDGLKVNNFDQVAKDLLAALAKKENYSGRFETEIVKTSWEDRTVDPGAENLPYPAAPGEKWIDVNLSRNTIAAYSGAKLINSPAAVRTGSKTYGYTPPGTYKIQRKLIADDMRGTNYDGSTYHVKAVPYTMYFHGGYAIHGAPWVNAAVGNSANGDRGSHGCVNVPTQSSKGNLAKWYYEWTSMGTTVRVHW